MFQTESVPKTSGDNGYRDTGLKTQCPNCKEETAILEKDVLVPGNGFRLPHKFCAKCEKRLD